MVPDGQSQIVIYGTAEAIDADPTGSSSAPTCKHSSSDAIWIIARCGVNSTT